MDNRMRRVLGTICTTDESGRHFTETVDDDDLAALENAGLIEIHRPVHEATGIPYGCEEWSVEITSAGQELVDEAPDGFDWTPFESTAHADDEVFSTHSDGSKALYLERDDETGRLYLCDANNRDEVRSDEEIDSAVAHWRSLWPETEAYDE